VAFPTGILLAERTLMLPSVGLAFVATGLLSAVRGGVLAFGAAIATVLAALGAARSWSRQAVWRDNDTLFEQSLSDGPRSYLNHLVYAYELLARGYWRSEEPNPDYARAKTLLAKAAELYGGDQRVYERWGYILRSEGRCDLAVPIFADGVAADPTVPHSRRHLFECLVTLGRYDEAIAVAQAGVKLGRDEFAASVELAIGARNRTRATGSAPRRRRPRHPGPRTALLSRFGHSRFAGPFGRVCSSTRRPHQPGP